VNDFDFNNRSYRVYVQADSKFRSQPKDIGQYYLRSDTGKMISLDNLVTVEQTANLSHSALQSFSLRGNQRNGRARPQFRRGHRGDGSTCQEGLPNGMAFEWSGLSLEESSPEERR